MDSGRCRRCGRAFTAGEVTALGILRPRPARLGGPVVEFPCPGCRTVHPLVPHGNGRFAFPGRPPPPPPSDAERVAPWRRPREPGATEEAPPPRPPPSAPPPERRPPPAPRGPPPTVPSAPTTDAPLTPLGAFDLLGIGPAAGAPEVEAAFRERALLCHPDKVAHLDADFVALATRKFRLLQEARDLALGVLDRRTTPPAS